MRPQKTFEFIENEIINIEAEADAMNIDPDYLRLSKLYELLDELSRSKVVVDG
mgnify:CR=1 FL=1